MAEPTGVRRLLAAWGHLRKEQRAVIAASGVLLLTMFLPWYSRTANAVVGTQLQQQSESKLAITVFSFVEAAIFLVALGVTLLMLARGDRRPFHLPGGDGLIVTIAGAWATFLIFFRFVDKPDGPGSGSQIVEYGLSWGIFFGLLAALALLVTGLRLRGAAIAEPALPGDVAPSEDSPPAPLQKRPRPAAEADAPTRRVPADDAPTRRVPADEARRVPADPGARPVDEADRTRAERRREREERRRAASGLPPSPRPTAETPVRERRDPAEEPTRHVAPGDAPTSVDAPPARRADGFEPPEFELPPPRRRPQS